MSSLRRDLIEKRLWPLVIILIAAIVAVPFLLAHHSPASATVIPPVPTAVTAPTSPASNGSGSGRAVTVSEERKQLHRLTKAEIMREAERNPFTGSPTYNPNAQKAGQSAASGTSTASAATDTTATDTTSGSSASAASPSAASAISAGTTVTSEQPVDGTSAGTPGAGAPASTSTVTQTVTQTMTAPAQTTTMTTQQEIDGPIGAGPWMVYSVGVRTAKFDFATHQLGAVTSRDDLVRLTPLPSAASPKVMFTGVTDHGHEAVFALGDGVKAKGKGHCLPDTSICSAIALPAGAVESITWYDSDGTVEEHALAVNHITGTATHDQANAAAAFKRHSQAGQCDLDLANPLQYDDTSGSVSSATATDCKGVKLPVPFPGDRSGS